MADKVLVVMSCTTKICIGCKQEKSLDEFYKNRDHKDGRASYCKVCRKLNNQQPYIQKIHRDREHQYRLNKTYGISLKEYDQIFEKQKGLCAICGQSETRKIRGVIPRLCTDHDHKTKKVRGLLCHHCNLILGNAKDDIIILEKTINYLKESKLMVKDMT